MTKMIVTISSISDEEETIRDFLREGVRIFRINLSHGTSKQHEHSILNIRKCSEEMGIKAVVCLDSRGPEVRIEIADRSEIPLKEGEVLTFSNIRAQTGIFLPVPDFTEIPIGSKIFLDDALLAIEVLKTSKSECTVKTLNAHRLKNNKKACIPGLVFESSKSEKKDKEDFELVAKHKIDVIFASFVNNRKKVDEIRKSVENNVNGKNKLNLENPVLIYSKIETLQGVENIDEIIEASDGIMVARGDLGVEITSGRMFSTQKTITKKCLEAKKPVICATQMLETMIKSPIPSRAEITDVGNAVLDQFDGLLLSGETAVGEYPTLAVRTMRKIIQDAEFYLFNTSDTHSRCPLLGPRIKESCVVIKCSSPSIIFGLYTKHFEVPLFVVSKENEVFNKLHMLRGVIPYKSEEEDIDKIVKEIQNEYSYKKIFYLDMGDNEDTMKNMKIYK